MQHGRPGRLEHGHRRCPPACTARGFGVAEFARVANCIGDVLGAAGTAEEVVSASVRAKVQALCHAFPIYGAA